MIEILGKKYKIVETNDEHLAGNYGASSLKNQVITLNKSISAEQRQDTLIHEIIHVISNELALELDEPTTRRLAVGLCSAGVRVKG